MPPPPPPPPCSLRSPPPLVDDALGEILIRFPPDDPARLHRLQGVAPHPHRPGLLRPLPRVPPGSPSLAALPPQPPPALPRPVRPHRIVPPRRSPSTAAASCSTAATAASSSTTPYPGTSLVWDPITGDELRLPDAPYASLSYRNAAVLCAAAGAGCDHRGCHGGHFLVAFVGTGWDDLLHAFLYSSATGSWSAPTSIPGHYGRFGAEPRPTALVGDALYFFVKQPDVGLQQRPA
ncbi:hypothetical protein BAE44_0017203, partial [Dichanthelium oligosanthes]